MNNSAAIAIIAALVGYWLGQSSQPDACVVEPPRTVRDFQTVADPDSLFVASDQPAVVIVADLSSEYASRWIANDAEQLREAGWNVRSLDLQGIDEVRFYVRANAKWKTHFGQMGMASLREMVGQ